MKWNSYNVVTETGNLNKLFYVNKKYISFDAGLILLSDDAINWKSVALDCIYPASITFGNGLYVLVSVDGKILTSVDAMNWTERYNDSLKLFRSIDYGENRFIAFGSDNQYIDTVFVIASIDGNSWTEINSKFTNKFFGSAVYGNNCYVIVGDSGTIYSSHDGNTWKPSVSNVQNFLITVIYEKEQFVAFGSKTIITSPDGIEWKKSNYQPDTTKLGGLRSMAYGNGKYVAVGYSTLISSSDGINWVGNSSLDMDYDVVAYGNGYFITINDNNEVHRSSDGITWTYIGYIYNEQLHK